MSKDNDTPIIYSTDWCGYCKMAKKYFEQKGVSFIEKNVERDAAAYQELQSKMGGQFRGVPVIDIKGTVILGFDRPAIDHALTS